MSVNIGPPGRNPNGGVNVGAPGATPGPGGLPDYVLVIGGLIIVGGIAELLYNINPRAGLWFAVLVCLGFVGAAGRLDQITEFLTRYGFTKPKPMD